jgi:hypothetical protein
VGRRVRPRPPPPMCDAVTMPRNRPQAAGVQVKVRKGLFIEAGRRRALAGLEAAPYLSRWPTPQEIIWIAKPPPTTAS